jgi:hypothetical protein
MLRVSLVLALLLHVAISIAAATTPPASLPPTPPPSSSSSSSSSTYPTTPRSSSSSLPHTDLFQWLEDHAATLPVEIGGVTVKRKDGGGGGGAHEYELNAQRDFEPQETIVQIPLSLALSYKSAVSPATSPLAAVLEQLDGVVDKSYVWCLYLIQQRFGGDNNNDAAAFRHVVATLPDAVPTSLFFREDMLRELDDDETMLDVLNARKELAAAFTTLFPFLTEEHPRLFPAAVFSFQHFAWAWTMLSSRATLLPDIGHAILPILAFADHVRIVASPAARVSVHF